MESRNILLCLSLKYSGDWERIYQAICDRENLKLSEQEIDAANKKIKSQFITILDQEYPEHLRRSFKPPFVLYYYGNISLLNNIENSIAIVGSRENSDYGASITNQLAEELSSNYTIVSGLAKGIDAIAHQAVINRGGNTIAVLGSGIDVCYPFDNKDLYEEIKSNQLLISEYPNKCTPDSIHFPIRNRIIVALSKGVLVTEAKLRSGTMITVNYALEAGKPVMCVPERANVDSGCNALIKAGATLVETKEDVLDELEGIR